MNDRDLQNEGTTTLFGIGPGGSAFTTDVVNHPSHYNLGKIEVIEFIEDQKFSYHRGNAVKYLCRAGKKNSATRIEDLKKAIWYIQREIELGMVDPKRPNEMNPNKPLKG